MEEVSWCRRLKSAIPILEMQLDDNIITLDIQDE